MKNEDNRVIIGKSPEELIALAEELLDKTPEHWSSEATALKAIGCILLAIYKKPIS